MFYDAIVVGAGPAGSLTAFYLAKAGLRVLVLDAEAFPRVKACGGGLQERATAHIPLDWRSVIRSRLSEVTFTYRFEHPFTRNSGSALVYGILRSEFDDLLLNAARDAGAEVRQRVRAVKVSGNECDCATLETSHGDLCGRYLIGADGANSVVARALNPRDNYYWQAALFAEIPERLVEGRTAGSPRMRIDWGSLPSGYAWVFPKEGSVNVGAGAPSSVGKLLRPYLTRFLAREGILRGGSIEGIELRGHQLPTLTKRTRLSQHAVLLVGDAAGLVEPLTGDGISHACHSAKLAAKVILETIQAKCSLSHYDQLVRKEVGTEMIDSRKLLALTAAFPRIVYEVLRSSDRVWDSFCGVLQGEESFRNLKENVLGPLRSIWFLVEPFLHPVEQYRLSRAMRQSSAA